jgi:hypothetical protein
MGNGDAAVLYSQYVYLDPDFWVSSFSTIIWSMIPYHPGSAYFQHDGDTWVQRMSIDKLGWTLNAAAGHAVAAPFWPVPAEACRDANFPPRREQGAVRTSTRALAGLQRLIGEALPPGTRKLPLTDSKRRQEGKGNFRKGRAQASPQTALTAFILRRNLLIIPMETPSFY